jgi:putative transposase
MSHWQAAGSQSVQAITDRLYLGWEAFFAGDIKRPPTFRKRRKYRSFTLKQAGYKVLEHGRIRAQLSIQPKPRGRGNN